MKLKQPIWRFYVNWVSGSSGLSLSVHYYGLLDNIAILTLNDLMSLVVVSQYF